MGTRIVVPDDVFGGWKFEFEGFHFAFLYHALQCDQRWIFSIGTYGSRLAYRTRGDATPAMLTYFDGGWWWPWQDRSCSGRR